MWGYPTSLISWFVNFKNGWTILRSLESVENELKNITQNFDSRDVSLVDRLSGLKYGHEDKIKKVKLIDEELLNLLEPKEYEVEYEKNS